MRIAMAGFAAAVAVACGALCAASTVEQGFRDAESQARAKALKSLQDEAFALKVGDKKTVEDFIEATDLPKTELARTLLQGVVERRPPRVYGDGDCEVRVGLSGDALRANLKRVLEQNYKKEGGEFSKMTFAGVGGKELEAGAAVPVALPARSDAYVAEIVPGWDRDASGQPISARKRIQTERAAYLEGLAALKDKVEKLEIGEGRTLGALMESNPKVKADVEKHLADLLPDRKLYWPKGIAEVRFVLSAAELWSWTGSETPPQKPLETLTCSGFAQLDGKPVNPADVVETAVPLDLNAMAQPPAFGQPLPQTEQAK